MTAQIWKESQSFNDERIKKPKIKMKFGKLSKMKQTPNQIPSGLSTRMAQSLLMKRKLQTVLTQLTMGSFII